MPAAIQSTPNQRAAPCSTSSATNAMSESSDAQHARDRQLAAAHAHIERHLVRPVAVGSFQRRRIPTTRRS